MGMPLSRKARIVGSSLVLTLPSQLAKAHDIKDAFIKLSEADNEFVEATETTTKSLTATVKRLSSWTYTLNNVLASDFKEPKLINNRIRF